MLKVALASIALATAGITFCHAQESQFRNFGGRGYEAPAAARAPVVTSGHIARLKAALRLMSAQHRHWPAVEAALRGLSSGSRSVNAAVSQAKALRRVASAARPLIASLNEQQKQDGMRVIRALGFSSLASAL